MAKPPRIEQTYRYDAPITKVFRALTDPKQLSKWFLKSAEIDPRKGGNFHFTWLGGYTMHGKVKEFTSPRRIAFKWVDAWDEGTFVTLARFDLRKKGSGTVLKLTHSGFKTGKAWISLYGAIQSGWAFYLLNLRSVLEHGADLRRDKE